MKPRQINASCCVIALVIASIPSVVFLPARGQETAGGVNPTVPNPSLKAGLVMPVKQARDVTTSKAVAHCDKGSLVFYVDTGTTVTFYDLHSERTEDVKVYIGKYVVKMLPGHQILVTSNTTDDFKAVNPGKGISFRNPKLAHDVDGVRVFSADFSIPSAIACIKPLKAMLKSEDPYQQEVIADVIKDAAILASVTGYRGPYTTSR